MSTSRAVRLPESFRGGCSFGAGLPPFQETADLSRRDFKTDRTKTRLQQGCQRRCSIFNGCYLDRPSLWSSCALSGQPGHPRL